MSSFVKQPFAMKQISQETFDEVVAENVEEFGMSADEALAEAITQFENQGVDLSVIDTSGGIGRDDVDKVINIINEYDGSLFSVQEIKVNLASLGSLLHPNHSMAKRNLNVFLKSGWNSILCLLSIQTSHDILIAALNLLCNLCKDEASCRDAFAPGGNDRSCRLLSSNLDPRHLPNNIDVLLTTLTLIKHAILKTENNKSSLMQLGIGPIIIALIQIEPTQFGLSMDSWIPVQQEAFKVIRGLCVFDDLRRNMSCAYDNGRYFTSVPVVVQKLVQAALRFKQYPALAAAAMSATKQLVLSEEAVRLVSNSGGEVMCAPQLDNDVHATWKFTKLKYYK